MSAWSQDRYIEAYRFAAQAHQGQVMTGSHFPYLWHISVVSMEVMAAVAREPDCDADLAVVCAVLHDVVEDTAVTIDEIHHGFGARVSQGVQALTKDPELPHSLRLRDSLGRIRLQPREIWMVKLADRITNLQPPPPQWSTDKVVAYRADAVLIHEQLGSASGFLADRLFAKITSYAVPDPV
jgi:(p)ppGpp synthase/HD superfamily hydrolase